MENENAGLQKRVDELLAENAALNADKKNLEQEVYRLRVLNTELSEKNDALNRENNQLSSEFG